MNVTAIYNTGLDVLLVVGTDVAGKPVQARGWMSATTQNYPASAYSIDKATGALTRDLTVSAAPMTQAEIVAYALALLEAGASSAQPVSSGAVQIYP